MAHARRGDSIPTGDGSLELDYFTDHGEKFVAVFTVFAADLASVYIVYPPAAVVAKARGRSAREKCLVRWILANIEKASAVRTFELADGKATSSH